MRTGKINSECSLSKVQPTTSIQVRVRSERNLGAAVGVGLQKRRMVTQMTSSLRKVSREPWLVVMVQDSAHAQTQVWSRRLTDYVCPFRDRVSPIMPIYVFITHLTLCLISALCFPMCMTSLVLHTDILGFVNNICFQKSLNISLSLGSICCYVWLLLFWVLFTWSSYLAQTGALI